MIIAYSKNGKPHAARKAESILLDLENRALTNAQDQDLPPKRGYYSDVIHALVKGSQKEDLDRAEKLLSRMVQRHKDGWVNILPDKALFDQVIDGWSRSNVKEGPLRAERLLQTMQIISKDVRRNDTKPDEKTYFHAITAWARSKEPAAPDRAEKLFFDMLEQYNKGDTKMKPSMIHYTTLIHCWARSGHPDGPLRAQQAFETVIAFYESGDKDFEPDSMLYHALMKSFSRTGDATTVESIFLQQFEAYASSKRKNMMPTTMSFNLLLEAWLNSGHPEAHKKATLVYDSMIEFTEEQTLHVPPDAFTFSAMIDIMVRSHWVGQAEKYLEMMKAARAKAGRRSNDKWIDQERRAMKRIQSVKRKLAEMEAKGNAKK
jgi:PPR repeat